MYRHAIDLSFVDMSILWADHQAIKGCTAADVAYTASEWSLLFLTLRITGSDEVIHSAVLRGLITSSYGWSYISIKKVQLTAFSVSNKLFFMAYIYRMVISSSGVEAPLKEFVNIYICCKSDDCWCYIVLALIDNEGSRELKTSASFDEIMKWWHDKINLDTKAKEKGLTPFG